MATPTHSLKGKVAFVTGAGTGIGKAIAERFAAEGATVVIAGRRPLPLEEVASIHKNIHAMPMDLTNPKQRKAALDATLEQFGALDILVNNAAYQLWKPFTKTTEQEIEELFATNMTSTTLLIKTALPSLAKSNGNIINISSTASRYVTTPSDNLSVYGSSKAGLNQLTRALAPEFGPMGVRINAIAPGVTAGEYALQEIKKVPGHMDSLISRTPMGRVGDPEDIANTALFLASDQAAWVTGQVIDASGGWQIAAG